MQLSNISVKYSKETWLSPRKFQKLRNIGSKLAEFIAQGSETDNSINHEKWKLLNNTTQ